MRILYHPIKCSLEFNPFIAPSNFDRSAQPVDIYDKLARYCRVNRTARYIYSFTSDISTLTLSAISGISYRWGETISGVDYVHNITSGTAFTAGSTKRYVIVKNTSSSFAVLLPNGAVWLYLGDFTQTLLGTSTVSYRNSYMTYIHCHNVNNIQGFSQYAFCDCANLEGVITLPDVNVTFGGNANRVFDNCDKIAGTDGSGTLVIPDSWTNIGLSGGIGNYIFSNMSGLTSVVIGSSVLSLAQNCFNGSTNIASLTFGGAEQIIGASAFQGLTKLTGTLSIPTTVQTIGSMAFYGCQYSGTLTISSTVTTIGVGAFGNNLFDTIVSSATNFVVDDISGTSCDILYDNTGGTKYEANYSARAGVTALIFRTDTTKILSYCSINNSLKTGGLIIPTTATSIGDNAFYACSGLTGAFPTIPAATLTLGSGAFQSCSGLTGNLVIPNTVTSIGASCFNGCTGLNGTLTIGTGITAIPYQCFYNCSGLTGNIVIPNNVTSVAQNAFRNMRSATGTLTLSANTASYTTFVFDNIRSSGVFNIPAAVTSINDYNFEQCTFSRVNSYKSAAPTIVGSPFGNYGCELHVPVSNSGYNAAPWTNTAIFSSVIADL